MMESMFKILLLLVFFSLLDSVVLTQPVPRPSYVSEWRALLELRSSLGITAKNWHKKVSPCLNWTGIECRNGYVIGINLSGLRRTRQGKLSPRFSIDSLQNFRFLSSFNSSGFSLPGSIPEWVGKRLSNLQVLDLRSCSISGSIPSSIGNLSKLNSLYLSDNSITGRIPSELGNLFSLSVLDLSQNLLTGQIPIEITAPGNLSYLDLSSNFLSGGIPLGFGSFSSLEILNLSNNSLSGSIPAELGNLSQLKELDLGYNSLVGSLPREFTKLRNLRKISVRENELEGSLAHHLFDEITQLKSLDFSRNRFVGTLPDSLWSISSLKYLDFSRNNLTGVFPSIVPSFNFTNTFFNFSDNLFYGNLVSWIGTVCVIDLSSNYFQGLVPTNSLAKIIVSNNCFSSVTDQRNSDSCRNFYIERGLSFGNDDNTLLPMEPPRAQPPTSRKRLTYTMIGVFGGLGFVLVVIASLLLLLKTCKIGISSQQRGTNVIQERGVEPSSKVAIDFSTLGDSFTYEQILIATRNFSNENLIKQGHSGDLFRGTLEGGRDVVVKRIALNLCKNEELDFFGKVTHPRLVPLVGHWLEGEKEKFLVYKYMRNRDLSNSLYRLVNTENHEELRSLDWITRLKIAIGAAEALSYLHHECNPPFVHRDIQASSILLDDKYEVRLGSLSEVCALGTSNNQNMISRLLRTQQSSGKQPSGSTSITCAHDVYCFGKVLLELVTGTLGISTLNDDDANQWLDRNLPFISIQDKELITKIIDQSLIIDEDLLEEVWAMAIVAKSCLNPKASRRPSMRHVLKALENPFKVVREETFSSGRLRTTSSRRSWANAFFSSWRQNSSDSSNVSGQTSREIIGGLRLSERIGSRGSGANNDYSSSHKRSSSDVFPEPVEMQDVERQDGI